MMDEDKTQDPSLSQMKKRRMQHVAQLIQKVRAENSHVLISAP